MSQRFNLIARPDGQPMTIRQSTPRQHPGLGDGPLPPKVAHRATPDIVVRQGNHEVEGLTGTVVDDGRIEVLHVPVRSYAQFANKIAKGGAAYERNTEVPEQYGRRWRRLLEAQRSGAFGDVYANVVLDHDAVAAGLASGELVNDRRLADALDDRKN